MKYSKEITEKICIRLKEHAGRVNACKSAGITFETFNQWMKDESKPEFSEAIKKAEEEAIESLDSRAVLSIAKGMEKQWQAGAWWLERTKKEKYGKNVDITSDNKPIPILGVLLDEDKKKDVV